MPVPLGEAGDAALVPIPGPAIPPAGVAVPTLDPVSGVGRAGPTPPIFPSDAGDSPASDGIVYTRPAFPLGSAMGSGGVQPKTPSKTG